MLLLNVEPKDKMLFVMLLNIEPKGQTDFFFVYVQAELGFSMNILDIGGGITGSDFQLQQVIISPLIHNIQEKLFPEPNIDYV